MLVKLGNYLDIKRGPGLPSENYATEGSLIRLTLGNFNYPNGGFKNNASKQDIYYSGNVKKEYILKKGDLITPLTEQVEGLLGETAWIPEDDKYIQNGDIGLVTPFENVLDKKYCYYLLSSYIIKNQLSAGAQQTKIRHTSPEKIKDCVAPIPSVDYQRKIGNILYEIDRQIERNNLMVKKLQVLSQGIFNKFFINETDYISLLDFPYIQIIKSGIDMFKGNKYYIATAEVDNDKVNYNAPLIEYETRENRANMQPVKNSVWFAKMKNSIKHIYVSDVDSMFCSNYIFSTGFVGIKCEDNAFEYLIDFINTPYFEMKKDILSHGATMEGVNNEDLKSIQIPLPSKDRLIDFHNKVKELHYQITMLNEQTFKLNNLKEKLLPLLINQQLS